MLPGIELFQQDCWFGTVGGLPLQIILRVGYCADYFEKLHPDEKLFITSSAKLDWVRLRQLDLPKLDTELLKVQFGRGPKALGNGAPTLEEHWKNLLDDWGLNIKWQAIAIDRLAQEPDYEYAYKSKLVDDEVRDLINQTEEYAPLVAEELTLSTKESVQAVPSAGICFTLPEELEEDDPGPIDQGIGFTSMKEIQFGDLKIDHQSSDPRQGIGIPHRNTNDEEVNPHHTMWAEDRLNERVLAGLRKAQPILHRVDPIGRTRAYLLWRKHNVLH
jgi:hypothetical protein